LNKADFWDGFGMDAGQGQDLNQVDLNNSQLQQVQAGRDSIAAQNSQVTIKNSIVSLFGDRPVAAGVDWDWAGKVLDGQLTQIQQRLTDVLLENQLFSIDAEERLDLVGRSQLASMRQLDVKGKKIETLDPDRMLIEVFGRKDIGGKLLILGRPGAGKTTTLLGLAQQLVSGALENPKRVIPVIFELSAWKDDKQNIQDFLIEQLYDNVGGNRKSRIYETWLEQRVLLPLLDGLDELGMERQRKCTVKLNEFAATYPQMVVCCRVREFENVGIDLDQLNGAIVLQPLSDQQIQGYLGTVNRSGLWEQIVNTPEMARMLEPDEEGEPGLLRVPLFISIAAAIYDEEQAFRSKGELLEKYIDRQLSFEVRKGDRRRKESEGQTWAFKTVEEEINYCQSKLYLTSLANLLDKKNIIDLIIDELQPTDIDSSKQRWQYWILLFSVFFAISSILGAYLIFVSGAAISRKTILSFPEILLFFGIMGGTMLSTESKADTVQMIFFVISFIFGQIFRVETSQHWKHKNVPVIHDIYFTNKFKLTFPNFLKIFHEFKLTFNYKNLSDIAQLSSVPLTPLLVLCHLMLILMCKILRFPNQLMHMKDILQEMLYIPDEMQYARSQSNYSHWISNMVTSLNYHSIISEIWYLKVIFFIPYCFFLLIACQICILFTIFSIPGWFFDEEIKYERNSNEGLQESCKFSFLFFVFSILTFVITIQFSTVSFVSRCTNYFFIFLMLINSMNLLKHLCLRITLTFFDRSIPWNYARFLNYCAERRLLQRIGGRYRFIHREVRDHFGKLEG